MKALTRGSGLLSVFASRITEVAFAFVAVTVGSGETFSQTAVKGFAPNPNEPVYSVVTQSDGKILVSGRFTQILGQARHGIARINADGTLDATFNSEQIGYGPIVKAVQPDGKILVDPTDGTARLSRLNADGSADVGFRVWPIGWDSEGIASAVPWTDGRILIGG